MHITRKQIFDLIEPSNSSVWSNIYDIFMMILIFCSIIPLAFRYETPLFNVLDKIAVSFFILEYNR